MTHEDDCDILARLSDHVPGESSRLAALDQAYRDGQLLASGEPHRAREILVDSFGRNADDPECSAWLDGLRYGLAHGSKGLRPRMELEGVKP
jgi:hypothetical protein